jgi:transcriptional regulator with XRE-family HTH domain
VREAAEQVSLGGRIRSAREERGLSVRSLAASAGVSPGFLSQLERGLADPSLETLRRIAVALGLPLFDLFREEVAVPAVVRGDARAHISSPGGGITYSRISAGSGRIEVLEGVVDPGGRSSDEPRAHPSDACVVVLAGRLDVEVDGTTTALAQGDSCSFDSRLPHRYLNPGPDPARFIVSVTPPSY